MNKYCISLLFSFMFIGCATYKPKYRDIEKSVDQRIKKEVAHTFYLIGDAGLSPIGDINPALKIFKAKLDKADSNSTAIFLGDNIYPAGLPNPEKSTAAYEEAKNNLDAQLHTLKNFKGDKFFIPGNHDWYAKGLEGLERQEKYIQKQLKSKEVFFPENGCPIEEIKVNDNLVIIAIDTEWYLTNWNKRPGINDKCTIKDRESFFLELNDMIKDNRDRTTLIVTHHPMFTYGSHGGQYSLKQNLYPGGGIVPLPFLGTFVNLLRRTTGASTADVENKRYRELRKRLVTLAQSSNRVVIASGHEHTLQYIVEENIPQIVSGSGAKKGAARLLNGARFVTGQMGYASLEIYNDGSSHVRFYGVGEDGKETFLYGDQVLNPLQEKETGIYPKTFPSSVKAGIYTDEEIKTTGAHDYIWGKRYRKYYGTQVVAPTVDLDTLYGGLTPTKRGGGNQSKSLRLVTKNGKQYVMRALRKSAEVYLQALAFKDQYIVGDFEDTATEELLLDFYTGAHPYGLLAVGALSDAVDIYHSNPKLYYVPKQKALKGFNTDYGNELYMLEEHVSDGHGNLKSFGYNDKIDSTNDLLENLRDDEKYSVNTQSYIRARLFDMLLGDWDRHVDQWRWARTKDKKNDKIIYEPIPRDRDQVFSVMGDGALMNIATRIVPSLRLFEGFKEEIRSVKGFNSSPLTFALDLKLLVQTTKEDWEKQAKFIQQHINAKVIDSAFAALPKEVKDETFNAIKQTLLARLNTLQEIGKTYHSILNKYAVITGTDKDDWFQINYTDDKKVDIEVYRIIKGKKESQFFKKTFSSQETKEIWVYGLDDDDHYEVRGRNKSGIKVRLIGGQNNDIYDISEGGKTYVYDFKSEKSTIQNRVGAKVIRTDDYKVNTYQPLNFRNSNNLFVPTIGFNPDDGVRLGFSNTYIFNGFRQNPFTQKHVVNAAFYFATSGFDIGYKGEFANISEYWNFEIGARFTSPNFSINFFGFGNETPNFDDDLGLDFNRVKIETINFSPSLVWRSQVGAKFRIGIAYESIGVEGTEDRFINDFIASNAIDDDRESFIGTDAQYTFSNKDNEAFPSLGVVVSLHTGFKINTEESDRHFGYLIPSLAFDYPLSANRRLVLATKLKGQVNFGNDFEFYQAATIGGADGLRGYRFQRFTGKQSFYQSTDVRYSFSRVRTRILPVSLGLYGGFDYGRVWFPEISSNQWNTSYGGGFFINGSDVISASLGLFDSDDGMRFSFGLGFGF